MNENNKINYIEFPSAKIKETKKFFENVFGWTFTDYGPDYTSFSNAGIYGGFYKSDLVANANKGGALVVIFSQDLEQTEKNIIEADGSITKPIFSFPGGRRFHFTDPNGNEYAVWSE